MVRCKTEGCKQYARYGYDYKVPLACTIHRNKEDKNMVNVVEKRCVVCLTSINPSFGYAGEKPTNCLKCVKENMINLRSKKCFCGKKEPVFGIDEGKPATHCAECKSEEMTNVKGKKCIVCKDITPSYGLEGTNTAIYCSGCAAKCKTDILINIKMKKCEVCNKISPSFGIDISKTATHCVKCKTPEMINVKEHKCHVCNINRAIYGLGMHQYTHCVKCKTPEMMYVTGKRCKLKECDTHVFGSKYDGYCTRCYVYMNPDKPLSRNYKTKERAVVEYIFENFKDYKWIWDKKIFNGSSLRRPDLYLDLGDQAIIIEIDENQHTPYDCSCNNSRLMELSKDINHKPLIFLRFNPDKYIDINNNKISSCFSAMPKTGILKVNNNSNWNKRLNQLKDYVDYWIENRSNRTLMVIEICYDQNIIKS